MTDNPEDWPVEPVEDEPADSFAEQRGGEGTIDRPERRDTGDERRFGRSER